MKNRSKKLLSLLLTLVMLVSMVSMATFTSGAAASDVLYTIDFDVPEADVEGFSTIGDTATANGLTYVKGDEASSYFALGGDRVGDTGYGGGFNTGAIMGIQGITLEAGKTYVLSGWMKGEGENLVAGLFNATTYEAVAVGQVAVAHDNWGFTPFSLQIAVPADAALDGAIFALAFPSASGWLRLDNLIIEEYAPVWDWDFESATDDETMKTLWGGEYAEGAVKLSRWGQFALKGSFDAFTTYVIKGKAVASEGETLRIMAKQGNAEGEGEPTVSNEVELSNLTGTDLQAFEVTLTMPANTENVWILLKNKGDVDNSAVFVDDVAIYAPTAVEQLSAAISAVDGKWNMAYASADTKAAFETALAAAKATLAAKGADKAAYVTAYHALVAATLNLVWANPAGVYNDFENTYFGALTVARLNQWGHEVAWSDENVKDGAYAIKMTEKNAWDAGNPYGEGFDWYNYAVIYPGDGAASWDATGATALTFWAYNGAQGTEATEEAAATEAPARAPQVVLEDANGKTWLAAGESYKSGIASSYIAEAPAGEWTQITVELKNLGEFDLSQITKVGLGFSGGVENQVDYFDSVAFTIPNTYVFNDFEGENVAVEGTEGSTVTIVTDKVSEGSQAAQMVIAAGGNPNANKNAIVISAKDGVGVNPAEYDYLVFDYADPNPTPDDATALMGASTVGMILVYADGTSGSGGWSAQALLADGKWNTVIVPLDRFKNVVDGNNVTKVILGEWNARTYYFDNVRFVKASALDLTETDPTTLETIQTKAAEAAELVANASQYTEESVKALSMYLNWLNDSALPKIEEGLIAKPTQVEVLNGLTAAIDALEPLSVEVDNIYNDFEGDLNGKLVAGDSLTATIVTDDVHGGTSAVKIDKTADGSDYPQAVLGVLPASGDTFDASGYGYLTFWLKDTQGENSLAFFILDAEGAMQSAWTDNVTVSGYTGKGVNNEWTKFVVDLSKFSDVDLARIAALGFAEWNTGVYYLDDIVFVENPYTAKEQLLMLFDEADAIYAAGQKYYSDDSWEWFATVYNEGSSYREYVDTLTEDECAQLVTLGREAIDGLTLDSNYAVTDYTTSSNKGGGYGFGNSSDAAMRFQTFYAAETGTLDSVDVMIGGNGEQANRADLIAHLVTVGGDNGYTPLEVLATVTVSAEDIPNGDSVVNIPITAEVTKGTKYALILTVEGNANDDYGWITYKDVTDENGDLNFIKIKGTEVIGSELQDESGLGVGYLKAYIAKDQGTVTPPPVTDETMWFNDFEGENADFSIMVGNDATGGLSDEAYQGDVSVNLNVTLSGWPNNANRIVWVLPDNLDTIDASGYNYLIFWVLDTQGPNSLDVYFQDVDGNGKNGWTTTNATQGEWTKFVVDISSYGNEIDMTQLMAIGFTEYNEGAYYIDAIYFANDPEAEMPGGDPIPPIPTYTLGDVNEDGVVDSKDARIILQASVDAVSLTERQQEIADTNEDGLVDSKDARWVLQKAVAE